MRNSHEVGTVARPIAAVLTLILFAAGCSSSSGWQPENDVDPEVERNRTEAREERAEDAGDSTDQDDKPNLDPASLAPGDRVWITTEEGERFNTHIEFVNVKEGWLRVGDKDAWYTFGVPTEAQKANWWHRNEYYFQELVSLTAY